MKRIVKKIAILVAILLIIDVSFGYLFKKFIFDKTLSGENGGSLNFLLKKKQDVDFLVLGSSRAVYHINPDGLTNLDGTGYNAGITGVGGVIYNSILLDICIHNKVKPKMIILQLDVEKFIEQSADYSSSMIYLYPFYDQSSSMKKYLRRDGIKESLLAKSNLYRFNGKSFNILFNYFKRDQVLDNNGFKPLNQIIDTTIQVDKVTKHQPLNFKSRDFAALKDCYNLCRKNAIKLVVVLPPYYNNALYDEKNDKEFVEYIHLKYPGIVLINMSDLSKYKDLMSFKNWMDNKHFNVEGATKFTEILNDSLRAL